MVLIVNIEGYWLQSFSTGVKRCRLLKFMLNHIHWSTLYTAVARKGEDLHHFTTVGIANIKVYY